jgi:hypothetical protein
MISLYQDHIPRSTALLENSLWWFPSIRTRSQIYRSRGEQSMMIWLDQNQIPRSIALLENSLWWFHSTRTRSHDLPLSWRTVYEDLNRPEPDPTIYRSRGEQSMMIWWYQDQIPRSTARVENSHDYFTLSGPDPTIYRSFGEQSMMISLYQEHIPQSTALVENSLWWFD